MSSEGEDDKLRSVAFQNSQSILLARRRAEDELRKQSAWLRVTLASIGDAVISTDADCRITFMNGVAESLTGWSLEQSLHKPLSQVLNIINDQKGQVEWNPALSAMQEQRIVSLANHTILIAKDGRHLPIDDSAAPIYDDAGTVVGAVLVFRDVSDRKKQESLLRESQERANSIVESIADALITVDEEWNITYINPRGEEILVAQQTVDTNLRGVNFWENFPQSISSIIDESLRRAMSDKIFERLEAHFPSLDRWFDIRAYPSRLGLSLYFLDITTRKRAEADLLAREQQFETLAESIPQLAWMANPDGHIFWYNQRWYAYTGTTHADMVGWGWKSVHDPSVLPAVLEKWQHSLDKGEPFDMVFPIRNAEGFFHPFLTRVVPVKDIDGRVVRWFGTNTDVTEQLRMAEELRTLAADLSEADRRKNEFLAILAHELRNPLAPIRNALQIVQLAPDDKESVQAATSLMERQIRHMVHLVDDLLDVSRITRDKIDLRIARVEVASLIAHAVEISLPAIKASNQVLSVTQPPKPLFVDADHGRLAQVISNLLNNASKYTDAGGKIFLTVVQDEDEIVITVKDTGVGIPVDMLPKIFDLFTQVDRSLERSQGGLGIGLTLVKRLAELHRGSVRAFSDGIGQGSEFVVRLPNYVVPSIPVAGDTPTTVPKKTSVRRILVVDDNRDSATTLALLLKTRGNETQTAYDGKAAVELAATFRPDIVLLDIGMPLLNGFEAAQKIRKQPWGKEMVLVALTGWGQEDDRKRSKEAGFNGHMIKPVDFVALTNLLDDLLP